MLFGELCCEKLLCVYRTGLDFGHPKMTELFTLPLVILVAVLSCEHVYDS